MKVRGPMRRMKRGSSIGALRPVKTISAVMPWSGASTITRSFCSGSITSMLIGPTVRSIRSMLSQREACSAVSTPLRTTTKAASAMFRCG